MSYKCLTSAIANRLILNLKVENVRKRACCMRTAPGNRPIFMLMRPLGPLLFLLLIVVKGFICLHGKTFIEGRKSHKEIMKLCC